MEDSRTLYTILNVHESCSEQTIKQAFHKLSRQTHPDRCKTLDHSQLFAEAKEAFDILRDPSSRIEYDKSLKDFRQMEQFKHLIGTVTALGAKNGIDLTFLFHLDNSLEKELAQTIIPNLTTVNKWVKVANLVSALLSPHDDIPNSEPLSAEERTILNKQS